MKPSFHTRLLNGPFEDPGLYVRFLREGRSLLFDLGYTVNLSVRDVLKLFGIFVTHAHIDHFIGFDNILRLHLKRDEPLKFFGPAGFIDHVEGKLRSYTWNLIGDYPLSVEVFEVSERNVKRAAFRAVHSFRKEDTETTPFNGILFQDSFFKVSTTVLDHKIPCLAFSLEEDYHINIDKARLNGLSLPVGPWLGRFKDAVRRKETDSEFTINDRVYSYAELEGIANITRGQKISYVVDVLGSDENMSKIKDLVRGSDILYIEAYFLHKDRERASQRYHLTAKQAGRIAREAGVRNISVFHFSPKYADAPDEPVKEAEEEFNNR
jgi:ribonuclease Z